MKEIVEELIKRNKTISTMESCTGGHVVDAITSIEGASSILKFSAVTYSNEYKIKMGVSKDIIDTYTVYSMETANAMSKAISEGEREFVAICITCAKKLPAYPCGVCRQFMSEFSKDLKVVIAKSVTDYEVFTLEELLPHGFDSDNLN